MLGAELLEVFGWQVTGPTGVDEGFSAQLRIPQDVYAQFDYCVKLPYHVFMEIVGDKGTLIIPNPDDPAGKESSF